MIEKILRDYLLGLVSVPVYVEVPSRPPGSYIVIERTGGSMENHIRSAMVAVQSIAPSMYAAAQLHEEVLADILGAAALDEISSVRINSEYNFPREDIKAHRYQAVFDITYY